MRHSLLLLAGVPVLLSACGESPPHPTVPVTGVVTFEGDPVSGATVDFVPQKGTKGHPGTAITAEDGSFELSTYNRGDGAVPGTHKVTVTLSNPGTKMVIAGMPTQSAIPYRYTTPQTTPFEFQVGEDQENHFELKLTPKPPGS